jgi:hypothetical protein
MYVFTLLFITYSAILTLYFLHILFIFYCIYYEQLIYIMHIYVLMISNFIIKLCHV